MFLRDENVSPIQYLAPLWVDLVSDRVMFPIKNYDSENETITRNRSIKYKMEDEFYGRANKVLFVAFIVLMIVFVLTL